MKGDDCLYRATESGCGSLRAPVVFPLRLTARLSGRGMWGMEGGCGGGGWGGVCKILPDLPSTWSNATNHFGSDVIYQVNTGHPIFTTLLKINAVTVGCDITLPGSVCNVPCCRFFVIVRLHLKHTFIKPPAICDQNISMHKETLRCQVQCRIWTVFIFFSPPFHHQMSATMERRWENAVLCFFNYYYYIWPFFLTSKGSHWVTITLLPESPVQDRWQGVTRYTEEKTRPQTAPQVTYCTR